MRRMSFSKTTEQMYARTKTVTRRAVDTWKFLAVGDELTAIEKGMGLAKGERQVVIGTIGVTGVRVEALGKITAGEVAREGFPNLDRDEFVEVFCGLNGRKSDPGIMVRVIDFEHLTPTEP